MTPIELERELAASRGEADRLRQTVASQQTHMSAIVEDARVAAVDATIRSAVDAAGIQLHPGALNQLVALLRPDVTMIDQGGGRMVPCGPGMVPAAQHIAARLNDPSFSHFRVGGGPSASSAAGHANQAQPLLPAVGDIAAEPLGSRIVRAAHQRQAARAAAGLNPANDISQPFGLKLPTTRR